MSEPPPSDQPPATQRWSWTHLQHRALAADIGEALVRAPSLGAALQDSCQAIIAHLHAANARIWTVDTSGSTLELQASAGLETPHDHELTRVAIGQFLVGSVAASRQPHVTNRVMVDLHVADPGWVRREKLVAFAGYPLLVADQLVGVLALFARHPLPSDTVATLASIADMIALGLGRLRAMSALAEQQERYQLIQRATNDVLWDWDLRTDVVVWNSAVHTALGYAPHEIGPGGDWWAETIHPDDRDRVKESIHRTIMGTSETWTSEYRFRRSDGTYAIVLDRGYLRRNDQGKAYRMVGSMLDVTTQRQAEIEREQLVVALTRSNQELDQFAYVASHDLKTPLRGIANLSHWIEDDLGAQASPELRRHLDLMRDRVQRLDALIDGILDYSRAGRGRSEIEPVGLDELVAEVLAHLAPPPSIRVEVQPGAPPLQVERAPLRHVLQHLVGNAVRHADREDLCITVAAAVAPEDGPFYHLSVTDNGPGIDPRYHERIWGIFQTLPVVDRARGTGIGLSVVKKIIESRGGKTWVESSEGHGAAFHVLWPRPGG